MIEARSVYRGLWREEQVYYTGDIVFMEDTLVKAAGVEEALLKAKRGDHIGKHVEMFKCSFAHTATQQRKPGSKWVKAWEKLDKSPFEFKRLEKTEVKRND